MNELAELIDRIEGDGPLATALRSALSERMAQDDKWGVQNHTPEWWLAILMEEVGELAQAILETHFDNGPGASHLRGMARIRNEAVQSCAVALAMIECIDRIPNARPERTP